MPDFHVFLVFFSFRRRLSKPPSGTKPGRKSHCRQNAYQCQYINGGAVVSRPQQNRCVHNWKYQRHAPENQPYNQMTFSSCCPDFFFQSFYHESKPFSSHILFSIAGPNKHQRPGYALLYSLYVYFANEFSVSCFSGPISPDTLFRTRALPENSPEKQKRQSSFALSLPCV